MKRKVKNSSCRESEEMTDYLADPFRNAKATKWNFPQSLPASDICLSDNVLISEFPYLNSCGSIVHAKGAAKMNEEDVALGIDCCGVCAKIPDQRFRCKKCRLVVYCSAAHQAADRGFHATVCEALEMTERDSSAVGLAGALQDFVSHMRFNPLPPFSESFLEMSLEEVFYEFIFRKSDCSEWKCLHFLHGTPLGRAFMEHASFPLTLWSQWSHLPSMKNHVIHVIGATRNECQYPALWSLLLPQDTSTIGISEISFFGPHVPKSLHMSKVHGKLRFFRTKYHNAVAKTSQNSPSIVFAPAMGITTGHYEWEQTLAVLEDTLRSGSIIITTCFSFEEMKHERAFLLKRFKWRELAEPLMNPFASTRIQQNSRTANDVYRSNSVVGIFQVC